MKRNFFWGRSSKFTHHIKMSSLLSSEPLLPSSPSTASFAGNSYGTSSPTSNQVQYGYAVRSKRQKKNTWGARERAGMSFLIVIAFFAVFGLIILTEVFMIDDKARGVVVLRHGSISNRFGDSLPDYDNVKEDYDLVDGSLLASDNKLGIFQLRSDNKLKLHDRLSLGHSAGNIGYDKGLAAAGSNSLANIPWGQVLSPKIEETLPTYPDDMQPTDGSWQIVNGTRFKFFVFSAYYDRRDGKMVRIIGATKTRGPERVWCRLWYPFTPTANNRTKYYSISVMARIKVIRENWNLKYSACFILCPLRAPGLDTPYSVSVVSRLRAPPGNILLLRNTDYDKDFANRTSTSSAGSSRNGASNSNGINQNIPDKMAVCVKPFHFNYDQALYLMEYIELNSLLGIRHFTFYNHTIGPHATCVLNHYIEGNVPGNLTAFDTGIITEQQQQQQYNKNIPTSPVTDDGIVNNPTNNNNNNNNDDVSKRRHHFDSLYVKPTINILPWNLNMRSQKEIRTEGLFAALNDCLYRNMYRYKYLALVDLDEFIIPRHNDTLNDLINRMNKSFDNRNAGAYSFQNAFFYLQFGDDPLLYEKAKNSGMSASIRASLVTQRKTRRRAKLHPHKQRSKYICKPESVVEAGNHFVWEFIPGKGTLNVPASTGMLHHYRVCEFGGDDCIKAPSILDRTATKYVNRLVERVEAVYNHLRKPCRLDNLPKPPTRPPPPPKRVLTINNKKPGSETESSNKNKKKTIVLEESKDGTSKVRVKYT